MHAAGLNTTNPLAKLNEKCLAKSIPSKEHPTVWMQTKLTAASFNIPRQ